MTDTPPHTAPAPARGPVAHDLPCAGCRYNLRGLDADGLCAECGMPIARSFEPDRLIFARPRWLIGVRRGLMVLFLTPPLTVLTGVGLIAWIELTVPAYRSASVFGLFLPGLLSAALWAAVVGAWLCSRPDQVSRPNHGRRWAARIGAMVPAVFFTFILFEPARRALDRFFTAVPPEFVIPPLLVLSASAVLVGVAGVIAGLARRARPARALRRWALINLAIAVPLVGLSAGVGTLALLGQRGLFLTNDRTLEFLTVCTALSWAGAGLSMLGLCAAGAAALRRESRAALDPALAQPPVPSPG